jgi:N-methylhydantoinase A/oxoprolinase/acetone carboxylase beta subunit
VATPVYAQDLIRCGNVIGGPAIIEAEDTTVVVEPGWGYTLDTYLNAVIERNGSESERPAVAALADAASE